MKRASGVTRRSFIANAASVGLVLPSILDKGLAVSAPATAVSPLSETEPLRLHRNESSYGLHPGAVDAVRAAATGKPNRYPIEEPNALVEALAKKHGVDKENILLGNGSLELLRLATQAFCSPRRAAVVAEPTYEAVVSYCPLIHARSIKVPLNAEHRHDLPKMLHAASTGAGMIFFCNPSNPAGSFVEKEQVERFVHKIPRGVTLLADEAYYDYVDTDRYESCLRYVKEDLPVVVSHTFSKVYGMAGLRVGYAIGRKDLIKKMTGYRLGNSPNQIATAAALAVLKDDTFVAHVRKQNVEVRDYMYKEIQAMGRTYIPTAANFVMIELGRPAKPIVEALKERHVLVSRLFPSVPTHMRVGLGTMAEMKLFVNIFREVMDAHPA